MNELLFLIPILVAIALVLGACRATAYRKILRRARRSFLKMVVGLFLLAVAIQLLLMLVPIFY